MMENSVQILALASEISRADREYDQLSLLSCCLKGPSLWLLDYRRRLRFRRLRRVREQLLALTDYNSPPDPDLHVD